MAVGRIQLCRLFRHSLRVLDAKKGAVTMELEIQPYHTNRLQILHGGTIASLVDLGGSLAVASRGYYATGVSTDLNVDLRPVSYMSSGGKVGERLKIAASCDKLGKTLAFTRVVFFDETDRVVARGSHTKSVSPPLLSTQLNAMCLKTDAKFHLSRFIAHAIEGNEPFVVPEEAQAAYEKAVAERAARRQAFGAWRARETEGSEEEESWRDRE
ncbi:hypothetical protein VTJ49DRAFT_6040 [Mycothermus thermophilus]|uniref:Thioesterase domain-containing protein n=1 Tax=Humicola insolens TaxID=85995 RepID=A0ABR3V272_HUMIN